MRDWSKGQTSSVKMQDLCAGGVISGTSDETSRFASLGASGKYPNNIQRDLIHLAGKPHGAPNIMFVQVPIMSKTKQKVMMDLPVLMPHRQFASLCEHRRSYFEKHIAGTSAELRDCRNSLLSHDFLRSHPAVAGKDSRFYPKQQ